MTETQNIYQLILELNKLKLVLRNTITSAERNESTAEHSWSAAMIVMILLDELKKEFAQFDEFKAVKLILIHDIVEVYAGDVTAFDVEARKNKTFVEIEALKKLSAIYPIFGKQLTELWHEFEAKESLEAKIAKAADAICPIFVRLHASQSYLPQKISLDQLDKTKMPSFEFSSTFLRMYTNLKNELIANKLI